VLPRYHDVGAQVPRRCCAVYPNVMWSCLYAAAYVLCATSKVPTSKCSGASTLLRRCSHGSALASSRCQVSTHSCASGLTLLLLKFTDAVAQEPLRSCAGAFILLSKCFNVAAQMTSQSCAGALIHKFPEFCCTVAVTLPTHQCAFDLTLLCRCPDTDSQVSLPS
jgi:hypothetical protein